MAFGDISVEFCVGTDLEITRAGERGHASENDNEA
jgi:hypothetical protein